MLSVATGLPVQPVTFSTAWGRVLGSWDRFLLPWPCGRGVIVWGEPLRPPPGNDPAAVEGYRLEIEDALTAITRRADELCGRAPVSPEPPAAEARVAPAASPSPSRA